MIYVELFLSFLQIGAFSFGGGYGAMPLIYDQVVNRHAWLSTQSFTDLITIAEMTPGPIAINAATFVGTSMGGLLGAIVATLGCILPSCVIVTFIAHLYTKYRNLKTMQQILKNIRPAVVSMIGVAGLLILKAAFFIESEDGIQFSNIRYRSLLYFVVALVLLKKTKMNPILIMIFCGLMEVCIQFIFSLI